MIEEHEQRLSEYELYRAYERADDLLAATQDAEDIARLRACARIVTRRLYGPELDEYFTLPEAVTEYEARFVERALAEEGGIITRAAQRLSISHQTLSFMLKTRHKKLQSKRKAEMRRKSIIPKGK
jgi:transcriptional regulator with PAS, ATPase and Fis domain